jgi:hypothetical protein
MPAAILYLASRLSSAGGGGQKWPHGARSEWGTLIVRESNEWATRRRVLLELPRDAHTPEQQAVIVCEQFVERRITGRSVLIHRRRANEVSVVFSAWIDFGCALAVLWTAWMMEGDAPRALWTAGRVPIFVLRLFEPHGSPSVTLRRPLGGVFLNSPGAGALLSYYGHDASALCAAM